MEYFDSLSRGARGEEDKVVEQYELRESNKGKGSLCRGKGGAGNSEVCRGKQWERKGQNRSDGRWR